MLHARDRCSTNATSHTYFFAETFQGKNGRVRCKTDRKNDTSNASEREREEPECRKRCEQAQIEDCEDGDSGCRKDAQSLIEEQQIDHDHQKTDDGNEKTAHERILTERRTNHLALFVVEPLSSTVASA